ncbi:MAG: hypothetical protein BM564_10285 [Bacteroidetes bacterium MedPE-SWsnd-G2]|nr:MAG: hypothetical protein BM564_10285 [Bacteroidetes bacterium MedPE-SWsnd-G2]
MKNNILKITLILCLALFAFSCDSDDATGYSTWDNLPSPTLNVTIDFPNSQNFVETEGTYNFTATLTEPQVVNVNVFLEATGTATEGEDFAMPHSLTIPAGSTTVSGSITIHRDTEPEETETINIQIGTGNEANVASTNGQAVSFTLIDYVSCTWVLETSDTYGDGWNGGYIEVVSEGVTTQYAEDDDEPTTFEIVITDGADYSFTYVSGGGTGAGPGWESENYYKLTAPDGTEWEDGTMDYSGIPTPGEITSGINDCP